MLVDLLVLGAGWSSTFLIPLCIERTLSYAATSREGTKPGTIKFEFNPDIAEHDVEPFNALPTATTVLITFPITVPGAATKLVTLYNQTHPAKPSRAPTAFILLGSSSAFRLPENAQTPLLDRHSPISSTPRADCEQEFLALAPAVPTTVLNLSGLWGGARSPRNWVRSIAPTKEALAAKGSLHLIQGHDLARAILAVVAQFPKASGQRWLLTDLRVYDWWDLASAWGNGGEQNRNEPPSGPQLEWVRELMMEQGLRTLPRDRSLLGRSLDSTEFWTTFGLFPVRARVA